MDAGLEAMPGSSDPVMGAQRAFRRLIEAMAHPGRVVEVEPPWCFEGLDAATLAVALTLFDNDTRVWLDDAAATGEVRSHLRLHCSCPLVSDPGEADFAVVADPARMPALESFSQGSEEEPERSATIVIQVTGLEPGVGVRLTGPGVEDVEYLRVVGVDDWFWAARRARAVLFPRGADVVFTCGTRLACLPRSTRVEG